MVAGKIKSPKKLERHFKGVANHRRIQILLLISDRPGLSLIQISEILKGNFKTIGEHTRRLVIAGLVEKGHFGAAVQHQLTPYGKEFVGFIKKFSKHGASKK
jgi:predicted transcriptional regulator